MYYKFWKRPTIFLPQFSKPFPHHKNIILFFIYFKIYDCYYML